MGGARAAGRPGDARPATEAWRLEGDSYALYTEIPAVRDMAARARLRPMAEYYRPGADGAPRLAAWQFAGPKEKVMRILAEARRPISGASD